MTKRFARGLVVGKFSPLHRGHEYIIEEAFRQCGSVVIISYSKPEFENCGRENRERWLAARFHDATRLVVDDDELRRICRTKGMRHVEIPQNDAEDNEHRQFVGWLCAEILGTTVEAVFTSEAYGDGFAAALSRYFGASVVHVCVDRERNSVPITGTEIRADPYDCRSLLSPNVYASFVRRVAILGAESSGKSTLAEALGARFETMWVPEYGRELWERRNGQLHLHDMVGIAREQIRREDAALLDARRWLFCDNATYLRLYVPAAARSIELDGGDEQPTIDAESGRQVVATFVTLLKGSQRSIHLRYVLPPGTWSAGHPYRLLVQKQPGTLTLPLSVTVSAPTGSTLAQSGAGTVTWRTNLLVDRPFIATVNQASARTP